MKIPKIVSEAFYAYNENAKNAQTKPMKETRLSLFAVLYSLSVVPSELSHLLWDRAGDRSMATARFRECVKACETGAKWCIDIDITEHCETRSANPRLENSLREAVKSYYSLDIDGKVFIVVPNKVEPTRGYVVCISNGVTAKVATKPKKKVGIATK